MVKILDCEVSFNQLTDKVKRNVNNILTKITLLWSVPCRFLLLIIINNIKDIIILILIISSFTLGKYLLNFTFTGNLMTYINREIDEIYLQYNILCLVSICRYFFIHFSRSVLLKLLKHVKLIVFENIMKVKQKNFFW